MTQVYSRNYMAIPNGVTHRKDRLCENEKDAEYLDWFKQLCESCYRDLILNGTEPTPNLPELVYEGRTLSYSKLKTLDIGNGTVRDEICLAVAGDREGCHHWLSCCAGSQRCCQSQTGDRSRMTSPEQCPRVWDGYVCWNKTEVGQQVTQECPQYLDQCWPGGT